MQGFEATSCVDDEEWMETEFMRACCNKAIIQLNRKDPNASEDYSFIKEKYRYMFNVTVKSRECEEEFKILCP